MCSTRSLWGTVCNREWTEANSRVVCRNLGYSDEEGIVTLWISLLLILSAIQIWGTRGFW